MEKAFKKLIVGGAIIALIILSLIVVWPIMLSIIAGLILAYIFYPVFKLILKIVKEKNVAAIILVLLIIFLIFIPLWFLLPLIAKQFFQAYSLVQNFSISSIITKILPASLSVDSIAMINSFISKILSTLTNSFSASFLNITNFIFQAAVLLFVFFFAMRDAEKLKEYVRGVSPFKPAFEHNLVQQFKDITNSVLYGHIVVGIIQGLMTGIGLYIFGIHQQIFLLTFIAIIAAVMPVIGAWLIWIPASIYIIAQGNTLSGIGLALYGAILISYIDNALRSYIVSRKTHISSAIVLVGMLGGFLVFGVLGFILGPLILSYLITLLDAYKNKKLAEFFSSGD